MIERKQLIEWLRSFEGPGSAGTNEAANALEAATSTIDRIDDALRGDARSAMLVVTAQEIINDYRDKADG